MREVIHSVLAAEAEAKGIVAAARTEAERIASDSQKVSTGLVARMQQEARAEADYLVTAAVEQAGREKEERLARLAAEIEAEVQLEDSARQRVVAAAVRCVCGLP
jgi:vacuolar-type H+-ATPase subunit H